MSSLLAWLRWVTGRAFNLLLIAAGLYVIVNLGLQYGKGRELESELVGRLDAIATVEARNQEWRQQLAYLQSDGYADYAERVAREQLNLARPGETVIVVITPTPIPGVERAPSLRPPATPPAGPAPTPGPAWQNWVNLILHQGGAPS